MEMFVGIDPSINSTGLTIQLYDGSEKVKENFYIITGNKLTKNQQKEQEAYLYFDYLLYEKLQVNDSKDNHQLEEFKTCNFMNIVDNIIVSISKAINYSKTILNEDVFNLYIVMEGISYGSTIKTKSVFDLAGLNFMIRQGIYSSNFGVNTKLIIGTPGEIKKYATGMGNANKDAIITLFTATYPDFKLKKIDDVADSYYMACYAKYIYHLDI